MRVGEPPAELAIDERLERFARGEMMEGREAQCGRA
jgi:hypothetical protein